VDEGELAWLELLRGGTARGKGGRDAAHCLYAGVLWSAGLRFVGAGAWLMEGN
jgi:hypothetical protein